MNSKRTIYSFEPTSEVRRLVRKEMRDRGGKRRGLLREVLNDSVRAGLNIHKRTN